MKKLLLSLLFLPVLVFGQNWNLINPDYQYHYRDTDSTIITVFVDSLNIIGNDTVFYLNRVVKPICSDSIF